MKKILVGVVSVAVASAATLALLATEHAWSQAVRAGTPKSEPVEKTAVAVDYRGLKGVREFDELRARVEKLERLLANVSVHGKNLVVSGMNLQVVSGRGATDAGINGLGNIILGYNETADKELDRSGSHNLVIGPEQSYASYGGLVSGARNQLRAPYASVCGGSDNIVTGELGTVSGGGGNVAAGTHAAVSGGGSNEAMGGWSAIAGGKGNSAEGEYASVAGGELNVALGEYTSVAGGGGNRAEGTHAAVSGGGRNLANGGWSTVGGGLQVQAEGKWVVVDGLVQRRAEIEPE